MDNIGNKTHLRTTTFRGRNTSHIFNVLNEIEDKTDLHVVNVGPGGAVKGFLDLLSSYNSKTVSRRILMLLESCLRKTNFFDLETSEPSEIIQILQHQRIKRLDIVDKEAKVLSACKQVLDNNYPGIDIQYHNIDVEKEYLPIGADVIFSYNTLQRVTNPDTFGRNLYRMMKPGAILSMSEQEYIFISQHISLRNALYARNGILIK